MRSTADATIRWLTLRGRKANLVVSISFVVLATGGLLLGLRLNTDPGYNYRIYQAIAGFFETYARLPTPGTVVGPFEIAANYADFPGLNLIVYRGLFSVDPDIQRALFMGYQLVPATVAAVVFAVRGEQMGLPLAVARLAGLVAVIFSIFVAIPPEDKTLLWWLPVLALLAFSLRDWLGAGILGVFVGWTGLAVLAPLLVPVRAGGQILRRAGLLLLSVAMSMAAFWAAGPVTVTLLENRVERESRPSFWYSIWQLTGSFDQPSVRTAFAVLLATLVWVTYWRRMVSLPASIVVMAAITLLASNSTVPMRFLTILPLGIFVFRTMRAQLLWLVALLGWLAPISVGLVSPYGISPEPQSLSGPALLATVLYVNGPLIVMVGAWGRQVRWTSLRGSAVLISIWQPNSLASVPDRPKAGAEAISAPQR